ncbi:MAG: glycoside hydrolase family 9 protein [Chitinivibrionales bacterium]|nr:glycoside hydrolase family 9 protein [Chitinivibrionales bacterium]
MIQRFTCALVAAFLITQPISAGQNSTRSTSPIRINQIGYEINGPKTAVYKTEGSLSATKFDVIDASGNSVFNGDIGKQESVAGWNQGNFYVMDFSNFKTPGKYKVKVGSEQSFNFEIKENCLFSATITPILSCIQKFRCALPDNALPLFGSSGKKIDLHGGYKEASGDEAKHICHLQFSNYLPTNEIPECVWGMLKSYELNSKNFENANLKSKVTEEIGFGADYLNRACSPEGFFYSTVFDKWGEAERTICAYSSKDGSTAEMNANYQTAFREGGGLSIAALAKASKMQISGEYTPAQYLATAKRAYTHIKENNSKYDDDGKQNLLDELEAGLAAIELFKATNDGQYKTEATSWIEKILSRQTSEGYYNCDDAQQRPYYHAASEGLPFMVLTAYLEIDDSKTDAIKNSLKKSLDWYTLISHAVANPFNYCRMYARPTKGVVYGQARQSFFMPHSNESNYWWQGENARLGSMTVGILLAAKALDPKFALGTDDLSRLAVSQIDWILGKNPLEYCMLLGSGTVNYPPSTEGGIEGGICNGITAETDDGGIMFNVSEWRSNEQWLPHGSYYLFAISMIAAMSNGSTSIQNNSVIQTVKPNRISIIKNHGTYNLTIHGDIKDASSLYIYDLHGQKIASYTVSHGLNTVSLSGATFSPGMYVAKLTTEKKQVLHSSVLLQ